MKHRATVVHLFAEYGSESVVWTASGMVPYEVLGLDPQLVADLQAWDASYFAGLVDFRWRDAAAEAAFRAAGAALGSQLARALGDEFVVRVDEREFRSPHPALNESAAAALRALDAADEEERDRIRRIAEGGAVFEWRAE